MPALTENSVREFSITIGGRLTKHIVAALIKVGEAFIGIATACTSLKVGFNARCVFGAEFFPNQCKSFDVVLWNVSAHGVSIIYISAVGGRMKKLRKQKL